MSNNSDVLVAMIVAQSSNRVIGLNNELPWHLSEDLKYFKSVTLGKPIIMGRKTYDSIGRPLPGRTNIVITRQSDWVAEGVVVTATIEEAIAKAKEEAEAKGVSEVMVIGGAQIYQESLSKADRIYLTQVDVSIEGDAFFPELLDEAWVESSRSDPLEATVGGESARYSFIRLDRRV